MYTASLSEKYAMKYLRGRSLLFCQFEKRNLRTKRILTHLALFMDKKMRLIIIVWPLDHPLPLILPLEFSIQMCNTDLCDTNYHHRHHRHKNDLSPYCFLRGMAKLHRSPSNDLASKGATLNIKC